LYPQTIDLWKLNRAFHSATENRKTFSEDGNVPHLLQYSSNCNYYGEIKVGGKLIRKRLWNQARSTAAKWRRWPDWLKTHAKVVDGMDPAASVVVALLSGVSSYMAGLIAAPFQPSTPRILSAAACHRKTRQSCVHRRHAQIHCSHEPHP